MKKKKKHGIYNTADKRLFKSLAKGPSVILKSCKVKTKYARLPNTDPEIQQLAKRRKKNAPDRGNAMQNWSVYDVLIAI